MTFTFSGNDTGGVGIDHFECNVDGLTFVTCTSPFTFPSSSEDGQYTVEIRAHDRVGNRILPQHHLHGLLIHPHQTLPSILLPTGIIQS